MKFITGYVCYAVPLCKFESQTAKSTPKQSVKKPKVAKAKSKVTKKAPPKRKTPAKRKQPTKKAKITL